VLKRKAVNIMLGVGLLSIMHVASAQQPGYIYLTNNTEWLWPLVEVQCIDSTSHLANYEVGAIKPVDFAPQNVGQAVGASVKCNTGDHMRIYSEDEQTEVYFVNCPIFNNSDPNYPVYDSKTWYEFDIDEEGCHVSFGQ